MNRRIAVVASTSGSKVGGAETVLRELGTGLAGRGWEVDLLTGTAEDIYTWDDVHPSGVTEEGPLTVRRFEAVGLTQPERDRLGARILAGDELDGAEQYRWVNSGMRLPGLFDYLSDHSRDYRAIVCGPYMFWACLALADLAPERTIVMPCLHDEPFARLDVYRYQLRNARGLWFLSEPERALAEKLDLVGERVEVVGSAVTTPDGVDPERFRSRYGIEGPYLFFAGRREWGKGWPGLLEDLVFSTEVLGEAMQLVACGVGEVGSVPRQAKVVDLGMISDVDRASGQAGAAAYLQPSAMESFSRTVLESFLLGTPVVGNGNSAVVKWHCERSGAGITYANRYEFAECLRTVRDEPEMMKEIGGFGPPYVRANFTWPPVLDRAERTIEEWTG